MDREVYFVADKLPAESSTALYQKATRLLMKDAFDRDSLPTGRSFDRISYILAQLRHADPSQAAAVTTDDGHSSSVRAELDSFAALLGKLSPGSAAGISRGHSQTTARSDAEDFWARLAHSRGDLAQLETLVGRTFGSTHHSSPRPAPTVSVEPVFIFHDKKVYSTRLPDILCTCNLTDTNKRLRYVDYSASLSTLTGQRCSQLYTVYA